MAKYVIGVIFIILVTGGVYYFLKGGVVEPGPAPVQQQQTPPAPTTQTYSSSTFSVVYPVEWSVDESYKYTGVSEAKPIMGVRFTIPGTMATGTNLSADSYVAVETLPRASTCTGDIYIKDDVKASTIDANGRAWSLATTSGAAAGSLYEEMVFAVPGSKPCFAVRYFIHSTSIGNYPPNTVTEYNRSALLAEFDKIRDSLTLGSSSATNAATTTTQ